VEVDLLGNDHFIDATGLLAVTAADAECETVLFVPA
jgi:hypothetical protein